MRTFRPQRKGLRRTPAIVVLVLAVVVAWAIPAWAGATTTRVSVNSLGGQANANSAAVYTSGPGRFVAFESNASNLVQGDTNGVSDIFLRDRATGSTFRISLGHIVSGRPTQANGPSHSARGVTPNGQFVAFESFASNLVHNDLNGTWDTFVRNRANKTTYRVSVSSQGVAGNGPSADPVISANGRFVAFESSASNLVGHDANGAVTDVFLRDRVTNTTSLLSVSSGEVQGNGSSSDPMITPDGRFVVFESGATNLVPDGNGETDIFVRDRKTGTTTRASVSSGGTGGNAGSYSPRITPNGHFVAFESFSDNLTGGDTNHVADVFVRDRWARTTVRPSVSTSGAQGNGFSSDPTISDDGRYLAFESAASNFVAQDDNAHVDVFIRDRGTNTTRAASVTPGGHVGNAAAENPWFSGDGRYLAFSSNSSNLVSGDTNGDKDVFVRGA
jgi:Tol biopolymer transport system component